MTDQLLFFKLLSCVQLFLTPWTATHPTFLSITNSQSFFKLMSIESVMPSNHLILCCLLLLLHQGLLWHQGLFQQVNSFTSTDQSIGASALVLPMTIQVLFTLGLTGFISLLSKGVSRVFSSCLKALILWSSAFMVQLTSVHDNWKNHSFD